MSAPLDLGKEYAKLSGYQASWEVILKDKDYALDEDQRIEVCQIFGNVQRVLKKLQSADPTNAAITQLFHEITQLAPKFKEETIVKNDVTKEIRSLCDKIKLMTKPQLSGTRSSGAAEATSTATVAVISSAASTAMATASASAAGAGELACTARDEGHGCTTLTVSQIKEIEAVSIMEQAQNLREAFQLVGLTPGQIMPQLHAMHTENRPNALKAFISQIELAINESVESITQNIIIGTATKVEACAEWSKAFNALKTSSELIRRGLKPIQKGDELLKPTKPKELPPVTFKSLLPPSLPAESATAPAESGAAALAGSPAAATAGGPTSMPAMPVSFPSFGEGFGSMEGFAAMGFAPIASQVAEAEEKFMKELKANIQKVMKDTVIFFGMISQLLSPEEQEKAFTDPTVRHRNVMAAYQIRLQLVGDFEKKLTLVNIS